MVSPKSDAPNRETQLLLQGYPFSKPQTPHPDPPSDLYVHIWRCMGQMTHLTLPREQV